MYMFGVFTKYLKLRLLTEVMKCHDNVHNVMTSMHDIVKGTIDWGHDNGIVIVQCHAIAVLQCWCLPHSQHDGILRVHPANIS